MPSHRRNGKKLSQAEQRKRRQEKFRKRTPSLFRKVKQLAEDTDAWVFLAVGDRNGQVNSIRSSNSFYWPSSIKELIKRYPSGTHEFIQKRFTTIGRTEVAEDENDSILEDSDTDSCMEDVQAEKTISSTANTGSDGHHYLSKNAGLGANTIEDKVISKDDAQDPAIEALMQLDCMSRVELEETDSMFDNIPGESDYTNVDTSRKPDNPIIDSLEKPEMAGPDVGREPGGMVVELQEPDMAIDVLRESNNMILNPFLKPDSLTFHVLGASGNAIDVLDTTELDPMISKYDTIDLEIPEVRSGVETHTGEGDSADSAGALCTIGQSHSPQTFGVVDGWEVIAGPKMACQDGRQNLQQVQVSGNVTGIDLKELLKGWNWVFQKK